MAKNINCFDTELNAKREKTVFMCKYNKPCSVQDKCEECNADVFESERNEETWEKFKMMRVVNTDVGEGEGAGEIKRKRKEP